MWLKSGENWWSFILLGSVSRCVGAHLPNLGHCDGFDPEGFLQVRIHPAHQWCRKPQVSKHPADIKALNIELASETVQRLVVWVLLFSPSHRPLLKVTKVDHPQRDPPVHRWGLFFWGGSKNQNCSCLTNQTTFTVPFFGGVMPSFVGFWWSIPATTLCTKMTIQVGRLWISLGDHFIRWAGVNLLCLPTPNPT